jgi:hypothetical protein
MSVMWKGGAARRLGWDVDCHGSGGPGKDAVGLNEDVLIDGA